MKKILLLIIGLSALSALYTYASTGQSDKDFSYFANKYINTIFDEPYIAPASYAEYARCGDVYCMFTEGYGYLHSSGYQAPVPVDNFAFLFEQVFKSDRDTLWHETKEALLLQAGDFSYISDLPPGFNPLFTSLRRFEMNGPIYNGRNYTIEQIETSDPDLAAFKFNQTRRVERAPYSGILYFNEETGIINRAELDEIAFYSFNTMSWVTAEATIRYMEVGGQVFVKSAEIKSLQNELHHNLFFKSEEPVAKDLSVHDDEYWRLSNQDRNPFIPQLVEDGEFESKFNLIPLDQIRQHLENDTTLEFQFIANSDKPYRYAIDSNDNINNFHAGQIIFDYAEKVLERIKDMRREIPPSQGFNPGSETLKLIKRDYNFGKVSRGSFIEPIFEIHNISENKVKIKNLYSDCRISEYDLSVDILEPGDVAKLYVTMNLRNRGEINNQIVIEADTEQRLYSVIIRGYVD